MLKRIMASYYYVKGQNKLKIDNDIEALEYFNKAINLRKTWSTYLSKGYTELVLEEYESGIISLQYSLQLIENSKKLNLDEKNYLSCYLLEFLIMGLDTLQKYNNIKKYQTIYKNSNFDIKNVRRFITKNYPLRGHEQWDDSYE